MNQVINRFKAVGNTTVNQRTRCFGYSGGLPNLVMDAKKSGLQCNPITGGTLLMFLPGKDAYLGGLDTLTGEYPKRYVDIMPADYATVVDRRFHLEEEFGWRNLPMLTNLPYEVTATEYFDMAEEYFKVVHPEINECPFGLNRKIQTSDPEVGDSDLVWQACPTCRLNELKSEACSERIFAASGQGLDSEILADLRATLIDACEGAIRHAERKNQMVVSDIARKMTGSQNGRNSLNTIDRIHLKMLHRNEPTANDTSGAEMIAKVVAETMKGVQAPSADALSSEEVAEYRAYQAKKAQMQKAREAKTKVETKVEEKDDVN